MAREIKVVGCTGEDLVDEYTSWADCPGGLKSTPGAMLIDGISNQDGIEERISRAPESVRRALQEACAAGKKLQIRCASHGLEALVIPREPQ